MKDLRAVALLSGGLDSTLAVQLLKDQGVNIKAIHFYTGFCIAEKKRRLGLVKEEGQQYVNPALRASAQLEVPIEVIDISNEYFDVITKPKYGYGKNVNPCVDCRILMLRKAKEVMEKEGYHFVITGEVLGQRPMSQTRSRLRIIERESGLEGYLLRPLSAKLLPPTVPENLGWVDRKRLLGIKGRGRKTQMEMAQKYGLSYEQPAGGCCYLTDESYATRFRESLTVEGCITREDLVLFSVGRHIRLPSKTKLIVARNEGEVKFLMSLKSNYGYAYRKDGLGTFALIKGDLPREEYKLVADIVARYSHREPCSVVLNLKDKRIELLGEPIDDAIVERFKIYKRKGDEDGTQRNKARCGA